MVETITTGVLIGVIAALVLGFIGFVYRYLLLKLFWRIFAQFKRHCFARKQRKIREQSEREAYQNQWVIVVDGHMHINRHRGCVTEGEECRPADPETMIPLGACSVCGGDVRDPIKSG